MTNLQLLKCYLLIILSTYTFIINVQICFNVSTSKIVGTCQVLRILLKSIGIIAFEYFRKTAFEYVFQNLNINYTKCLNT